MQLADELVPGPGHARADGADRAPADGRGPCVVEPQQLGEDERGPPVGVEAGEDLVAERRVAEADLDGAGSARSISSRVSRRRRDATRTASTAARLAIDSSHVRALASPR